MPRSELKGGQPELGFEESGLGSGSRMDLTMDGGLREAWKEAYAMNVMRRVENWWKVRVF